MLSAIKTSRPRNTCVRIATAYCSDSALGMKPRHVFAESLPGGANIGTGRALETTKVYAFRLYMMFHMAPVPGREVALETAPEARGSLLQVPADHGIQI